MEDLNPNLIFSNKKEISSINLKDVKAKNQLDEIDISDEPQWEPDDPIEKKAKVKKGMLDAYDIRFIEDNYSKKSAREIARILRRGHVAVNNYITKRLKGKKINTEKDAEYNIKSSPMWSDLKKQFSETELKMFLYNWRRVITQFKLDVLPTEELQIMDMIKLEILMNRALTEQNKSMQQIRSYERELNEEREKPKSDQDRDRMFNLEKNIGVLRAAQQSLSDNYQDMLQKKNSIFKDLKSTRSDRIKVIESYKHSFSGWISKILSDAELRKTLGENVEKMRLAAENEYDRLSNLHTYADGVIDQPLLTPENLIE